MGWKPQHPYRLIQGVRRARAMVSDSEAQDSSCCGGTHLPDKGRPTCGSARMMYAG